MNGISIRLTEERWLHIVESHDDLVELKKDILTTISDPDIILKGERQEFLAVKKIYRRWLVVIYKETTKDGFIITAFTTTRIQYLLKKETIWIKQS